MATSSNTDMEKWLYEKLTDMDSGIDIDVFVTYITSMLDEDTEDDEILQSLQDLLSEISGKPQHILADQVLERWKSSFPEPENSAPVLVDQKLSELFKQKTNFKQVSSKNITDDEKAAKTTILSQYSQVEDNHYDPYLEESGGDTKTIAGLSKNVNTESVVKAQQEIREKSKQEAASKREKDKVDRAAQKQKQQERKDQEKKRTQKGERKR